MICNTYGLIKLEGGAIIYKNHVMCLGKVVYYYTYCGWEEYLQHEFYHVEGQEVYIVKSLPRPCLVSCYLNIIENTISVSSKEPVRNTMLFIFLLLAAC